MPFTRVCQCLPFAVDWSADIPSRINCLEQLIFLPFLPPMTRTLFSLIPPTLTLPECSLRLSPTALLSPVTVQGLMWVGIWTLDGCVMLKRRLSRSSPICQRPVLRSKSFYCCALMDRLWEFSWGNSSLFICNPRWRRRTFTSQALCLVMIGNWYQFEWKVNGRKRPVVIIWQRRGSTPSTAFFRHRNYWNWFRMKRLLAWVKGWSGMNPGGPLLRSAVCSAIPSGLWVREVFSGVLSSPGRRKWRTPLWSGIWWSLVIRLKPVRNNDFVEVTVKSETSVVLKGCFIYGFRNIQNLIMRMKVGVASGAFDQ